MAHQLPPLPYAPDALEPHIDTQTMQIHHGKHHQAYVTNLNGALEKYPEFQDRLCVLPSQLGVSPDDVIKYQLRARTMMEWTILWSRTAIITVVFAMLLLNLYYRLLVDTLPHAA